MIITPSSPVVLECDVPPSKNDIKQAVEKLLNKMPDGYPFDTKFSSHPLSYLVVNSWSPPHRINNDIYIIGSLHPLKEVNNRTGLSYIPELVLPSLDFYSDMNNGIQLYGATSLFEDAMKEKYPERDIILCVGTDSFYENATSQEIMAVRAVRAVLAEYYLPYDKAKEFFATNNIDPSQELTHEDIARLRAFINETHDKTGRKDILYTPVNKVCSLIRFIQSYPSMEDYISWKK